MWEKLELKELNPRWKSSELLSYINNSTLRYKFWALRAPKLLKEGGPRWCRSRLMPTWVRRCYRPSDRPARARARALAHLDIIFWTKIIWIWVDPRPKDPTRPWTIILNLRDLTSAINHVQDRTGVPCGSNQWVWHPLLQKWVLFIYYK